MAHDNQNQQHIKLVGIIEWLLMKGSAFGLVFFLILLIFIFRSQSPHFLSIRNAMTIGRAIAITAVAAAGQTIVLISGGIDLSISSIIGITGVLGALLMVWYNVPLWLACLAALCIGTLLGLVNGLVITRLRINPVLTTLATMSIFRGIALLITATAIPVTDLTFREITRGHLLKFIPIPFVITILVYFAVYTLLNQTIFGWRVYAIGGNPEATRRAGVDVDRWKLVIYSLSGFIAAIAGIMTASQGAGGWPTAGQGTELSIVSAVVLGGCSLGGGAGSIWGTLLGVLVLGVLANGLTVLQISPYWQFVTRGLALIGAIVLDIWRGRGAGQRTLIGK